WGTRFVSVTAVPVPAGLGVATSPRLRSAEPLTAAELSTTMQCEKADVLPVKSVAVAVTVWPGGVKNGRVVLKLRLPPPFVFWVMNPIRFCPSPDPEASHDWLEKNSILIGVPGGPLTCPVTVVAPPELVADVRVGAR